MILRWSYLFWGGLVCGCFFFDPLLKAVGPEYTTVILCTAFICIVIVKIVEFIKIPHQIIRKIEEQEGD
jgi:hypothetical protein